MRVSYTIWDTGVFFVGKDLQTLNGQNKLALWVGRISACRNSGVAVKIWCRENGICEQIYYKWQRRIFEMAQAQQNIQFAEVTPVQPVRSAIMFSLIQTAIENDLDPYNYLT